MRLSGKLLDSARGFGADALVTACPLCQMNLDMRQGQINDARRFAVAVWQPIVNHVPFGAGRPAGPGLRDDRATVDPVRLAARGAGRRRDRDPTDGVVAQGRDGFVPARGASVAIH